MREPTGPRAIRRSFGAVMLCATATVARSGWNSVHAPPADDAGAIRIHLLGHAIGSERYAIRGENEALVLTDTFEFTDRGGRVQLASTLRLTPSLDPLELRSSGRTYRFVNVDAQVDVDGNRVRVRSLGDSATFTRPRNFFAIAGYAPLESQALLIRYWQTHGRPREIVTAPGDPTTSCASRTWARCVCISRLATPLPFSVSRSTASRGDERSRIWTARHGSPRS